MKCLGAAGALCFLGLVAALSGQPSQTSGHGVGLWTTASVSRLYPPPEPAPPAGGAPTSAAARAVPLPNNQTLRQIVRVSIGGECVRVVLTSAFGTAPLAIGGAHIALREKESAIVPASERVLTFSGKTTLTIPAGALIVSDPVSLTVPASADVAISRCLGAVRTGSPPRRVAEFGPTSFIPMTIQRGPVIGRAPT